MKKPKKAGVRVNITITQDADQILHKLSKQRKTTIAGIITEIINEYVEDVDNKSYDGSI